MTVLHRGQLVYHRGRRQWGTHLHPDTWDAATSVVQLPDGVEPVSTALLWTVEQAAQHGIRWT